MKKILSSFLVVAFIVSSVPSALAATVTDLRSPSEVLSYNANLLTGLFNDQTDEALSTDAEDVNIPAAEDDAFYIAYDEKFNGIEIDIDVSLEGYALAELFSQGTYVLEYWDGNWKTLSSDKSNNDLKNESTGDNFSLSWDRPEDWETVVVNSSDALYYVRLRITDSYKSDDEQDAEALASQVWVKDSEIVVVDDGDEDDDGDGLTKDEEDDYGTSDSDVDSDNDGVEDGTEVDMGTDPDDSADYLANYPDYEDDCNDPFDDTNNHWAEESICALYSAGVVEGRSHDEYEPNMSVTRAEFLKIALLNAELTVTENDNYGYTDVDSDDWFYSYVTYATGEGYTEGYYDNSFRPNDSINRAEAMTILMRIAGVPEDEEVDSDFEDMDGDEWFAWAVMEAVDEHIVEGYDDGEFKPENYITRAETAVIARRAWYVYYE
ncbi:MAG: S-layer homology domain-containing protein [Patescibacteria group bacterium]